MGNYVNFRFVQNLGVDAWVDATFGPEYSTQLGIISSFLGAANMRNQVGGAEITNCSGTNDDWRLGTAVTSGSSVTLIGRSGIWVLAIDNTTKRAGWVCSGLISDYDFTALPEIDPNSRNNLFVP